MGKKLAILLVVVILLWPAAVLAQGEDLKDTERIESFSSRVAILPQGGIDVTETIILVNHGDKISWGLERLLPRWHDMEGGLQQALGYEFLEVLRDGEPAEYLLTDTPDGMTVTVGDPALSLPPGRYVYTLSYRCSRLVQFHAFAESLSWNATGSWPVPVERVAVSLEFFRAPRPGFEQWSAIVGAGEIEADWSSTLEEGDWLRFETTRPLAAGEAMIVKASWPRGYALPPSQGGRILNLDCQASLDSKRLLTVQEQITVSNDGSFNPGFIRDFPNLYQGPGGGRRIPELEIGAVQVNGRNFPWTMKHIPGGRRLTVGDAESPLPTGEFQLAIAYSLNRQVNIGRTWEELRWQLPGFPLDVEIDQVRLTLELPGETVGAELLLSGFTRLDGETGSAVFHYPDNYGRIVYAGASPLAAGEQLICSAAWPAGLVPPLTWQEEAAWLLRDNASAAASLTILILLLFWYILLWLRRGRRPMGKAEPTANPPDKFSPALLRCLRSGVYDNRTFSAACLSLAVKGCLMIVEEEGKYALVSSGISPYLPPDEEALIKALFAKRMAVFPAKHKALVKAARRAHKQELKGQMQGLFCFNRGWFGTAAGLSLLGAVFCGLLLPVSLGRMLGLAGFVLWGCLLARTAVRTGAMLSGLVDDRGRGTVALTLLVELILASVVTYFAGRWLAGSYDWLTVAAVLGIIAVNAVFSRLLAAPTAQGREVLAQVRGFRAWLLSAEAGQPGGPARFEKFLPYAVALDASSRWGRRFGFPKRRGGFSPRWYQGSRWHTINAEALAASLSMLPKVRDRA